VKRFESQSDEEPDYQFETRLSRRNTAFRRVLADIDGWQGRLLEAGCGSGRFLRAIQEARPDLETFGVDISPRLLAQARERGGGPRYAFGSVTQLPFRSASMDVVVLFDVLEHVPNPEDGVAEVVRVLKPGGVFHALVPCEGQPLTLHWAMWKGNVLPDLKERHGGHIQRFTHGWVRQEFARHGLEVRRIRYSMHPVGQVKDVLTYVQREDWFSDRGLGNPVFGAGMKALWAGAFVEAQVLSRLPAGAVTMHVQAVKAA
jgi:ubiquinone/menaquinone biosynthesis C-methylase UbiE